MTNGLCERFNSTLGNMLGTLSEHKKIDWKAHLSSMTHAYNCTQHPSTTYSPYFFMFGRQPRLPIDFEMGLPVDVLGDSCSKTRYAHRLIYFLFSYKKAKEMSQKQAQKYKSSYDKKFKGSQLQVNDIVLVKRVAWKGRHKIQNKWEPSEYIVVEQPNLKVPVYRVKSLEDNKIRVLLRNMLLPLGIKFIPEEESNQDSEEEPELEQCQFERQVSEKTSQHIVSTDMTPLAQSNLEHGQEHSSSNIEHVNLPVDHVDSIDRQQGSIAPPTAFSSDQLLDPQMSLDPQFLVPIEDSMGSDSTKSTHLSSKYNDTSLMLSSTQDNSDSLIKTEEFLEFVDELSQEPSPLSDREGTSKQDDTVPSVKVEESSHSINVVDKTSESVNSSIESQDISIDKVPKGNDVESTDISITESQFSSTMPYCEESFVAKLESIGESQFLSAQPCHKADITFSRESADLVSEVGISEDSTKDCSSGTSASKIPTEVTHVKFDSVSDFNTESQVDHGNMQFSAYSNIEEPSPLSNREGTLNCDTVPSAKAEDNEPSEPSEPSPSPFQVRRSTRSTRGMPPTRYGSVVSHQVNVLDEPGRKVEFVYWVWIY